MNYTYVATSPHSPSTPVIVMTSNPLSNKINNLVANPRVRISVAGHNTAPATARRLPTAEADSALADYARRHPRALAKFKNVLENTLGTTISEQDTALPVLELRLDPRTPVPS